MATYKTLDLINMLSDIIDDGYEYVEVSECEEDDDLPAALWFEAVDGPCSAVSYEDVESKTIPDDYDFVFRSRGKVTDKCHSISFTYKELFVIDHALANALEHLKECSQDPACPKDDRDQIKTASIDMRNLQAKLAKLFKTFTLR